MPLTLVPEISVGVWMAVDDFVIGLEFSSWKSITTKNSSVDDMKFSTEDFLIRET